MKTSESLYQPSLQQGWTETKSYDISRLFLVAFFGGAVPLMIMGGLNAKWLNVPKKSTYPLIAIGILLIIAKFVLFAGLEQGTLTFDDSFLRYGYKIGCVLLFLLYSSLLKKPFQQHMMTVGTTLPMLKPALLWMLLGVIVEFVIMFMVIVPLVM